MIQIQEVTKQFGSLRALDNFSLDIAGGTVLGLLGPNGAGKTTMMRIIAGYLQPTSGNVIVDDVEAQRARRAINQRIGYLPENNPLYEDMLVEEYLQFVASLRGMDRDEARAAILRVVKETGLKDVYYKGIDSLSKGYRQRLGIAQAIIHKPDILILDEPTEGLDPNQRVEIRNLIRRLGEKSTVIVSTHVLQEVSATCDRLAIINKGKLVTEGSTETLLTQGQGQQQVVVEVNGKYAKQKLSKIPGASVVDTEKVNDRYRFTITGSGEQDLRPEIFKAAAGNELVIYEMYSREVSLEELFRKMTLDE